MKKLLYPVGVLAAALAMFGAFTLPAQAQVSVVHPSGRAEAHTNSTNTRVGVSDTVCDNRWARVDIKANGEWTVGYLYDFSCGNGGEGRPALMDYIRVCVEDLGCSEPKRVT